MHIICKLMKTICKLVPKLYVSTVASDLRGHITIYEGGLNVKMD